MQPTPSQSPEQNKFAAQQALAKIKAAQNFNAAIVAGLAASVASAVLWAAVTVMTQMQLGLIAIAIGFLVGKTIRKTGHGIDKKFGILGAVYSFIGCVLGNTLSAVAFYARAKHLGFFEVLSGADIHFIVMLMTRFSQDMDVLFYGISIYEGYRFSFKYRLK